ncbi:hypothetical protein AND_003363 [Anopheles darlingi]|uniref:Uncharacterized protein n=1 Tax=Anopheles darlingi TaxID=43151 RepID=W5JLC6_ANODA|nr:hypothetical protein AND_003363 [Anopheles darlingi]
MQKKKTIMRLPSETNSSPPAADLARGNSFLRNIRRRFSDSTEPPAALPAVDAAPDNGLLQQQANGGGGQQQQQVYNRATVEVQPVVVRKTPKFPSRERHLAIRRKNRVAPPTPMPELSPPGSPVSCGRRLSK